MNPSSERLNKVLAQLGYGSRRSVDKMIEQKRVFINGTPAVLGQKVTPNDILTVDGEDVIRGEQDKVLLAFNKPKGVTTTKRDRFAKVTVMDFLPPRFHNLFPIGRLDRMSRGLLLFTNDGLLAQKLSHPRYSHKKEYNVTVIPMRQKDAATFEKDMYRLSHDVLDPLAQSKPVIVKHNFFDSDKKQANVTVVLEEGKNRQIRRIFTSLGYFVVDLLRTHVGPISLDQLKEGEYRKVDIKSLVL